MSVGPDGATHQAIEDIALMRVIPGMVVIAPADAIEAKKATLAAAEYDGPVYIRLARDKPPVVTTEASPFAIGKAEVLFNKDESHEKTVGLIVTGVLAHNALQAALLCAKEDIGVTVLHMPCIKPLDAKALDALAAACETIVTLEEHQVAGGLGGAVSEYYCESNPKRVVKIGVNDEFGQSGEPEELIAHYGLDGTSVAEKIIGLF